MNTAIWYEVNLSLGKTSGHLHWINNVTYVSVYGLTFLKRKEHRKYNNSLSGQRLSPAPSVCAILNKNGGRNKAKLRMVRRLLYSDSGVKF